MGPETVRVVRMIKQMNLCHERRSILTHDAVQRWIDAYVNAWRTYDPAAIGALFAEKATYAYHPYDRGEEVVQGREAIVADWLEERDEPGTWEASYRPWWSRGSGR